MIPDETSIDRQEFFRLYASNNREVYSYIRTLMFRREDADDVFQETSMILWKKFGDFQPGTNFTGWACRIAYLTALNLRRQRAHAMVTFGDEFFEVVSAESQAMSDSLASQYDALADCYQALPQPEMALIEQRYRVKVTVRDVAQELGRSLRSVYRDLERIHRKLLECIERKLDEKGLL